MNYYKTNNKNIHIMGRTSGRIPTVLFWTASGIELVTDSRELWFDLESDYGEGTIWIRIEIDGFCMQRMILPRGRSKICAFRGFPSGTKRNVKLLRETQPVRGDEKQYMAVHGFECDGSLYPVDEYRYKFEFIGDSLTTGEGLAGSKQLFDAGTAMYGIEGSYAVITAKHFGADFRLLSQSGWGVHCSCDNDKIRIMPPYYEKVCGVLTGENNRILGAYEDNSFSAWEPDLVIVNLGSNDGFAFNSKAWTDPADGRQYQMKSNPYGGADMESAVGFERSVIDFLKKIRHYNPKAYILWIYGMCDHTMTPYIRCAVNSYIEETADSRVSFQVLPSASEQWVGSSGHPGIKGHAQAAQTLISAIDKIMEDIHE